MNCIIIQIKCKFCKWVLETNPNDKEQYSKEYNHFKEKHPKAYFTVCFERIHVYLAYDFVKGEFIQDIKVRHSIFGWHYERYGWGYDENGKVLKTPLKKYLKEVREKKWIYH